MQKAVVCSAGFRATVAALLDLNFWFREFPSSSIANRSDLRCKLKATGPIVLQNLSFLLQSFGQHSYFFLAKNIAKFTFLGREDLVCFLSSC